MRHTDDRVKVGAMELVAGGSRDVMRAYAWEIAGGLVVAGCFATVGLVANTSFPEQVAVMKTPIAAAVWATMGIVPWLIVSLSYRYRWDEDERYRGDDFDILFHGFERQTQ